MPIFSLLWLISLPFQLMHRAESIIQNCIGTAYCIHGKMMDVNNTCMICRFLQVRYFWAKILATFAEVMFNEKKLMPARCNLFKRTQISYGDVLEIHFWMYDRDKPPLKNAVYNFILYSICYDEFGYNGPFTFGGSMAMRHAWAGPTSSTYTLLYVSVTA